MNQGWAGLGAGPNKQERPETTGQDMKSTKNDVLRTLTLTLMLSAAPAVAAPTAAKTPLPRPQGPCDVYAAAGAPCVAAHATTRALYAAYNGPLYQVLRQSDGKTLDIGVVAASATDAGGYADAAKQDAFCANTTCWISILYDQSGKHNDLVQPPRGAFSGPAMGGFNNLPIANMAPITVMGHKVYGVFIAPGMGLRQNDAKGTAVDDQAEGQYWVINGQHFNSGCCFDYGNAETDSRDDGNGTMETTFFGNTMPWYHGNPPGPWIMTDQENNLVGCVNEDKSKLCANLPNITWRFVTAMAKGKPHHWTSLGGDARQGPLAVMFDGRRIDATYDPMRKQGAILLGNGGDNSNQSQGTFYEGAMTAAGTFPSDATDQLVQANVVSARYDEARVRIAPASAIATPPGLQTFVPGTSQETTVIFTNTTGAPVSAVRLSVGVPKGWTVAGSKQSAKAFASVAPGATVQATFKVTSGPLAFNGDLSGTAAWTAANGAKQSETAVERVRNAEPVKINEFRISDGSANTTNSFVEIYNAGSKAVDLSNWTLTEHPTEQAISSTVTIPANTKLAPQGTYLLGLANSGLAVAAKAGDDTLYVRSVEGMKAGDSVRIDTGAGIETRTIAGLGSAAGAITTLWQPLPDGPVITIPAGSTNVPVTSTDGFVAGEKIALGHGAGYPAVGRTTEQYEVATVTAVGKTGTQAWLSADAAPGATNIKVTSVANISVGDSIRLDIDSVGHGIETVTVAKVGSAAKRTALTADAKAGDTTINVRAMSFGPNPRPGLAVGDKITIGMPGNRQTVTVTAVTPGASFSSTVTVTPALTATHVDGEDVVEPGTGLDITAPLKFAHADNMPFSARGTGISFAPATAFAHSSNEPVRPLGSGIKLDKPLTAAHAIDAVVQDDAATVGYRDSKAPSQWFGGPVLSPKGGAMVLRDASGHVVDSLNYGLLVDPWISEGYQAVSGAEKEGCLVAAPGVARAFWWEAPVVGTNVSASRSPDGRDTDSNCSDFVVPSATTTAAAASAGATDLKVIKTAGFQAGQTIVIDAGVNREVATITKVGTAGAAQTRTAATAGATTIAITNARGFEAGQTVDIDTGAQHETAVVTDVRAFGPMAALVLSAPLHYAHPANVDVSGTGLTLAGALTRAHAAGAQVVSDVPTPGAPNKVSAAK